MIDERDELAQALADKINPPFFQLRSKKLPLKDRLELPVDELYERVWFRKGPDDQPYVTFTAGDGCPSFRNATFREIADAVLALGYSKSA